MNKQEQDFCTQLSNWLRKTGHEQSMLCEVKVVKEGNFLWSQMEKSQIATLNRLEEGLPIAHKIGDKSPGSKLVDLLFISKHNTPLEGYIAVKFMKSGSAYLVPYGNISMFKDKSRPEALLKNFQIW